MKCKPLKLKPNRIYCARKMQCRLNNSTSESYFSCVGNSRHSNSETQLHTYITEP